MTIKIKSIWSLLSTLFFLELFLCASGRVLSINEVTIKMILFITMISFFLTVISVYNTKINFLNDADNIGISMLFVWVIIAALIGIMNNNKIEYIQGDLRQLIYILIYYPLYYSIMNSFISINKIFVIVKISATIMSLLMLFLMYINLNFGYSEAYSAIDTMFFSNTDFMFRENGGCFYKGIIYVLFSLILVLNELLSKVKTNSLLNYCMCFLFFTTLLLCGTRMLACITIFAFCFSILMYKYNISIKSIILVIVFFCIGGVFLSNLLEFTEIDRLSSSYLEGDASVLTRIIFIQDALEIISNPINLIFGAGLGTETSVRKQSLEISFLDILMEQGLVGMILWFVLIGRVIYLCMKIINSTNEKIYIAKTILVYMVGFFILTNTNPFINNPIGLGGILTFLIILKKLYMDHIKSMNK